MILVSLQSSQEAITWHDHTIIATKCISILMHSLKIFIWRAWTIIITNVNQKQKVIPLGNNSSIFMCSNKVYNLNIIKYKLTHFLTKITLDTPGSKQNIWISSRIMIMFYIKQLHYFKLEEYIWIYRYRIST